MKKIYSLLLASALVFNFCLVNWIERSNSQKEKVV